MSMNDEYLDALVDQYLALDRENTSRMRGPMDAGPYASALESLGEMIGARFLDLTENRWAEEDYLCLRNVILNIGAFLLQFATFGRLDSEDAYRLAERLWKSGFNFLGLAWPDD